MARAVLRLRPGAPGGRRSCRSARAAGRGRRRCGSGRCRRRSRRRSSPGDRRARRARAPARPRWRCRSPAAMRSARCLLLGARLRQCDRPAFGGQAPADLDPARLGPELVGARGAVDQDHGARAAARRRGAGSARTTAARRRACRAPPRPARAPGRARGCAARPGSRSTHQPARRRTRGWHPRCDWPGRSSGRAPGARSAPTW